jgi:hypothetical protein
METIKFRGLSLDTKKWIYGYVIFDSKKENASIVCKQGNLENHHWAVVPETVGQYVGLKDKNGKEIYSGDITNENLIVKWNILHNAWCLFSGSAMKSEMISDIYDEKGKPVKPYYDCEIIGNIHETNK